jgi:hypothetical protein
MKLSQHNLICRLLLTGAILIGGGCTRRMQFSPLPAARGGKATVQVELTYDRNNTLLIEMSSVPDPATLNSAYTRYVLWVATPDRQTIVNAGQIRVTEDRSAKMQTLTPLRDFILFITAEAQGDVASPGPDVLFETREIHW